MLNNTLQGILLGKYSSSLFRRYVHVIIPPVMDYLDIFYQQIYVFVLNYTTVSLHTVCCNVTGCVSVDVTQQSASECITILHNSLPMKLQPSNNHYNLQINPAICTLGHNKNCFILWFNAYSIFISDYLSWTQQFLYSRPSDGGKIALFGAELELNVTSHSLSGSDCISDSPSGSDCFERWVSKQMKMTEWKPIAQNLPICYLYSHHVFMALDLMCSCIYACIFPNSHTILFSIFHLTTFRSRKTACFTQ